MPGRDYQQRKMALELLNIKLSRIICPKKREVFMKNFKNVFFATLLFAGAAIATTCNPNDPSDICRLPLVNSERCNYEKETHCSYKTPGCEKTQRGICFGFVEPGHYYPVVSMSGGYVGRCRCE